MTSDRAERVLVTGASGFIGSHLVRALADRGFAVYGLDRKAAPVDSPATQSFQVDLRDRDAVAAALTSCRPSIVYHLAAQSSVVVSQRESIDTIETNVTASALLAELAADHGARRFVFFSTGGAMYGDPSGPSVSEDTPGTPRSIYGATKLAAEHLLSVIAENRGLQLSVLRPGNVFGPGQDAAGESGVVAIFAERMLRDEPVSIFGDGSHVRDYVFVTDVVDAAIRAASAPPALCHVSTGVPRTTLNVFEAVAAAVGYTRPPVMEPARQGEIQGTTHDPARARQRWGWQAETEFDAGIRATVESLRPQDALVAEAR